MTNISDFIADYVSPWLALRLEVSRWSRRNKLKFRLPDWRADENGASSCWDVPLLPYGVTLFVGWEAMRQNEKATGKWSRLGFGRNRVWE